MSSHPKHEGPRPPFPPQEQPAPGLESKMTPKPDYDAPITGLGRLRGKVAVVTGGDSGIGRAVCLAFAREGADVAFTHLAEENSDARETEQLVRSAGHRALALEAELSTDEACRRTIEEAVKAFGRIDILVNNAAYQGKQVERFDQLTAERVEQVFRVNIIAMFHLVRHALPHMKPGSSIINVASIQAYKPSAPILDYASTKGAIVTFTKGLAQELIERGIRVNCVAPGPVWTPLIAQSFKDEKIKKHGESSPMKRPAQPGELAPAFVFLASEEGRYVNGEILGVTGGQLLA